MKTDDLIVKYPLIFQPYPGNPGGINWMDVPQEWLPVIDSLCGAIQNYVDNYRSSWINPTYDPSLPKDPDDPRTVPFTVYQPQQVRCLQMKSKWGQLRFYVDGADDKVEGMIKLAEWMCR